MNLDKIKIPPQIWATITTLLIILVIVYILMKRLGLIKSKVSRELEVETQKNVQQLTDSEFFNPNLYRESGYGYSILVPGEKAEKWAQQIFDAWGFASITDKMIWDWFNDNEAEVYNVFRNITNKLQISQIADAYSQMYKRDLLGDIQRFFNDKEMSFLWNIIKSKPNP